MMLYVLYKIFLFVNKKMVKQYCIFFLGFVIIFKIENVNIIFFNVNQFGLIGSFFKLDGFYFYIGRYNSMMGLEYLFDDEFILLEVWFLFFLFLNV